MRYNQAMRLAGGRDPAVDHLRAMVTAQSALIFGLLTVLAESRVVPHEDVRAIFEAAIDMVDSVDTGLAEPAPQGISAARMWLQQLLDDMPGTWAA